MNTVWLMPLELRITTRLVLLLLLAFVRCVLVATEQPLSTLMQIFPYFKWLENIVGHFLPWLVTSLCHSQFRSNSISCVLDIHEPDQMPCALSSMAPWGHANIKPTVVFGNWFGPQL